MKKRFLPFIMAILVFGQFAIADNGGHYVPRTQQTNDAESYMASLRVNQNTGLIDPADMLKAMQNSATKSESSDPLYWISMGPDNMGGQTTAILFDKNSNLVYAGAKGGGVYKSYNFGVTWHQVGGLSLMVSCMTQDAAGTIYVGTGDGNNAHNFNGLSQQGYTNSFVGTGLYSLVNDEFTLLQSSTANEWCFINELACAGDILLAATDEGLKYSADNGLNWTMALSGKATAVKVGPDNTIFAGVDGQLFIGQDPAQLVCHSNSSASMVGDSLLPKANGLIDMAVSPKNANIVYAMCIGTDGKLSSLYVSENKGNNWSVALPSVTYSIGNDILGGYGLYNHGLVVDPKNDGIVYVLGYYLWSLSKPSTGSGYYLCKQITSSSYYYMPDYLHVGLHTMVFNPKNDNECYVGTDGGVFKGTNRFTFSNCNRNYVTTRMFSVGVSGKDTRVLASGLDHGAVLIQGDENSNTLGYGVWVNPSGANMGVFDDNSHAGSCAISNINPNTIFVTAKNGSLNRSQTAGADWVSTNFTSSVNISNSSFRMPIILKERFDDPTNPTTVWFKNEDTIALPAGAVVQCMSENEFPFNYTLTDNLGVGDSIEVHDPISAKMYIAFKDALYVTLTPLNFSLENSWFKLSGKNVVGFTGEPLCMNISADGDVLFCGFKDGKLFRLSNLNTVVDAYTGTYDTVNDSGDPILNPSCQVETKAIELPMQGQCVTSVSIDPRNPNRVVVTCGNYGNDNYVFYSDNAMSDTPTFVSAQGNLPQMPVYSSLIEMATGDVLIGTERGIYKTTDISNPVWVSDGFLMGDVPVMELKQQIIFHETQQVHNVTTEGVFTTVYPGVYNTGIVYAATYGKGVFRCENYKKAFTAVPENPAAENPIAVGLYPNPVSTQATVTFDVKGNSSVSYQVFDMMGRMVMNQNMGRFAEGNHQIQINTDNLSAGSYILRLNQNGNNAEVKFVVY